MPESTIIIPVFNQAALTSQCLGSLLEQRITNIIVVDDGSTDSTPKILAGFGDKVRVITHKENRGFAISCNDGAAMAQTGFLVFLNNDTIPQAGWLAALQDYARNHPEASVIGSKLLYPDKTVQHAGVVICQDKYPRHIYSGFPADHPCVSKSRRFQVVTGASMLVRHRAFEEARGFESAFRNGFEDVDLCLRLGAQGHEVHYCAESIVQHFESVSPGRFKNSRHNVTLYRQRWMNRVEPDDLHYYVSDGLLKLSYEGRYPISMEISPLLSSLDREERTSQVEQELARLKAHADALSRENARMRLELGACTMDSPELEYVALRQRLRETVVSLAPTGAIVLVVSKGDPELLHLPGLRGWHFPQNASGSYAGYHPASSAEAIRVLEALRARGANYLLIPATSLWWLDYYREFRQHLATHYCRLSTPSDLCVLYQLSNPAEQASMTAQCRFTKEMQGLETRVA